MLRKPENVVHFSACSSRADVVFLVDGSTSVGATNFDISKGLIRDIIGKLNQAVKLLKIAIIQYSSRSRIEIKLRQFRNMAKVFRAVKRIKYRKGGTYTHLGLRDAKNVLSSSTAKNKVLFVLTDGRSKSRRRTINAAMKLKQKGVRIIVAAVGKKLDQRELRSMASRPVKQNLVHARSFKRLRKMTRQLRKAVCQGEMEKFGRSFIPKQIDYANGFFSPFTPDL